MPTGQSTPIDARRCAPVPDEVRAQLEKVLSSSDFDASGRNRAFLRYVVEETLAGNAHLIKGYGLTRAADFAGLYGRLRAGAVVADRQLKGGLWLANTAGAQIHLVPNRQGLALNVGADGLVIDFGE